MKSVKTILTAVLLVAAVSSAAAQDRHRTSYNPYNQAVYYRPLWPIDWRPAPECELYDEIASRKTRRYTLAVHPFHLVKEGMKIDFETELRKPGQWLQIGLTGYYAPGNEWNGSGDSYHRWGTLASGFEAFSQMAGGGISVSYKEMFSSRGFYFNTGLLYNYYDVESPVTRYVAVPQDGLVYYERKRGMEHTGFHQPALFFNVGKHMALNRNLFIDAFTGVGYMYSIYKGETTRFDEFLAFGYRGSYINLGLRLGVLWHGRK